jgi:hypothetical protein
LRRVRKLRAASVSHHTSQSATTPSRQRAAAICKIVSSVGGCAVWLCIGVHLGLGKWSTEYSVFWWSANQQSSDCCRRSSLLPAPSRQSIPAHLAEDRGSSEARNCEWRRRVVSLACQVASLPTRCSTVCWRCRGQSNRVAMCSALRQPRGENPRWADGRPSPQSGSPVWVPARLVDSVQPDENTPCVRSSALIERGRLRRPASQETGRRCPVQYVCQSQASHRTLTSPPLFRPRSVERRAVEGPELLCTSRATGSPDRVGGRTQGC